MRKYSMLSATIAVAMFAALLSAAPAKAGMIAGVAGNVFSVFNDRGQEAGQLMLSAEYRRTYGINVASGAMVVPAESDGTVRVRASLVVADQATNPTTGQSWGLELQLLDRDGWKAVSLDPNGVSAELTLSSDRKPGLYSVQARYRFRAGREYSGFRFLGLKMTLDAKTGSGSGVAAFWLHIVEPTQGLNLADKDATWRWVQGIRRQTVNGTEQAAVGGLYPLFTPTEVVPASVPVVQVPTAMPDPRVGQLAERAEAVNATVNSLTTNDAKLAEAVKAVQANVTVVAAEVRNLRAEAAKTIDGMTANVVTVHGNVQTVATEVDALAKRLDIVEAQVWSLVAAWQSASATPSAPQPAWTAQYCGDRLIITALSGGVVVRTSYGADIRPALVLSARDIARIKINQTVRAVVTAGEQSATYGPNGQIK